MKHVIFSVVISIIAIFVFPQSGNKAIPAYSILKPDGKRSSWNDLKKDKAIMIVYFMPDCPHCQSLTKDLTDHISQLKNIQIVMITCTKT